MRYNLSMRFYTMMGTYRQEIGRVSALQTVPLRHSRKKIHTLCRWAKRAADGRKIKSGGQRFPVRPTRRVPLKNLYASFAQAKLEADGRKIKSDGQSFPVRPAQNGTQQKPRLCTNATYLKTVHSIGAG